MATATIALVGRVTISTKANVRQGAPNTKAPVARKLLPGTIVDVRAIAIGEAVQGNAHWYQIDASSFVWAGACDTIDTAPSPAPPPPAAPPASTAAADIDEAGLGGFGLTPAFAAKLAKLILECRAAGHMFRISQGLRTPRTQALYYCQWAQRSPADIDVKVGKLRAAGAPWTADLLHSLRDVARIPNWQTNALPGAGWHQWGEAADCYCYRGGKIVGNGSDPSYLFYAETAEKIGLTAGLRFSKPDAGHVQLRSAGGATDLFSWAHIDAVMQERFSGKPSLD